MKLVKVLVETLVDEGLQNAQMSNAREIIARLDPECFHVTTFHVRAPDDRVRRRRNTRLIRLPESRQTIRILTTFLVGDHDLVFYVKASPASRAYAWLRSLRGRRRLTVACVESQANWKDEPTITPENVRLIEQTILRADYLFSNSPRVQQSLHDEYGLSSKVVPTGVDTEFFCPALESSPLQRAVVLFVGSLRPFKRPDLVLEAARRFPQADFVLVGDGVLASELRRESGELPNVLMTGSLNAMEIREQYRRADVFFFPSAWEGSPKVLAEAAACGVPAVARDSYEPQTVIDGKTGILCADDVSLLDALKILLKDAVLRRSMGRAARQHIAQFDWNAVTRKWEEVFLRVTSQNRTREVNW